MMDIWFWVATASFTAFLVTFGCFRCAVLANASWRDRCNELESQALKLNNLAARRRWQLLDAGIKPSELE